MAKKKQIEISNEELVSTTLYIRPDKKKTNIFGVVWIVIIFGIFVGGVIYLPEISAYVSSYINPDVDPVIPGNKKDDKEEEETPVQVTEFEIASNPEISNDLIKINNIVLENGFIKFKITNLNNDILDLSKMNYFINLYDNNKKLLERIFLQDIIASGTSIDVSYTLVETPTVISLVKINESDYPAHVVEANENGTATMTCKKDNETVDYLLNDNKVYASIITYTVGVSDPSYQTLYGTYKALETSYNSYDGVTSNIEIIDSDLVFKTIVNLNSLKADTFALKSIYELNTDAKIIYFINTASGYTCN